MAELWEGAKMILNHLCASLILRFPEDCSDIHLEAYGNQRLFWEQAEQRHPRHASLYSAMLSVQALSHLDIPSLLEEFFGGQIDLPGLLYFSGTKRLQGTCIVTKNWKIVKVASPKS